jgi:hypothetical protein
MSEDGKSSTTDKSIADRERRDKERKEGRKKVKKRDVMRPTKSFYGTWICFCFKFSSKTAALNMFRKPTICNTTGRSLEIFGRMWWDTFSRLSCELRALPAAGEG